MKIKNNLQLIGGIFLIVGTSIGAGMLALPVANAETGFPTSSVFLLFCWILMTFSAFLILEVNLCLPPGSNMISMARATLGKTGALVAWFAYLFLLYALLCAYISGGSDIFQNILGIAGLKPPFWLSLFIFVSLLGGVVYRGIRSVDYVNMGLMISKLSAYVILVLLITPHVNIISLEEWDLRYAFAPIMVLITSFGFAIIVPSLRSYFHDDVKQLRKVILIGSIIPLIAYWLWDAVIMGVIPQHGAGSLDVMLHSGHATIQLTKALQDRLQNNFIAGLFRFFSAISMLTAFLGVSLSLSDFFADGFGLKKSGKQGIFIYGLTFVPPIFIVLFYPNIFIAALGYAGIFCTILLMLLPLLMAYSARYKVKISHGYQVASGKLGLCSAMFVAVLLLVIGISEEVLKLWSIHG